MSDTNKPDVRPKVTPQQQLEETRKRLQQEGLPDDEQQDTTPPDNQNNAPQQQPNDLSRSNVHPVSPVTKSIGEKGKNVEPEDDRDSDVLPR